ncbi:MAG: hypothetical protein Q8M98_03545 [Candidatus Cloacimonadaceae bacterium]|nr:hypothetical protein [Candidatus Cloacimonadaceae bacterium]MDP3113830.1 hypothetical protein [Candidatus Cloacimonadaceae bacterium]
MKDIGIKKFIPAVLPLLWELFRHFKRDSGHNNNIKKFDKTQEKLATVEHLIVRLEKTVQQSRETTQTINNRLQIWLALNSAILIAIAVKLFFY